MRKILISALLVSAAMPAQAAVVYHYDFDAPAVFGAGISLSNVTGDTGDVRTADVGPWNAAGWSGRYYRNATAGNPATKTELTFTGLGAHNVVSMSFIVGLLDSWDSRNGNPSPDNLDIFIDGALVASLTAANASGSIFDYGGGTEVARCVQADGHQFYCDTLVDWSKTFAHSGSTLKLGWQASGAGWQAGDDESWGVDNIKIDYFTRGGVPEPAAWAMMLAGFGITGAAMRKRKKVAIA
ncbi:MAG: PEPxxWA-CTERM sorting domain-containing protein [Chakrabartia godavariana]